MNQGIPEIKNPLQHSGTHQFERLSKEMEFSYVQLEERHQQDFLEYAYRLASQIQYYNDANLPFGTWKELYDLSLPESVPHRTLFIAFLRLLEALHEHANGLSKRHLDYYYKEVLEFTKQKASAKHCHLFFECSNALSTRFIEKGAKVHAGTNSDGKEILFELVDEIVVNKIKLKHYFSLYQHSSDHNNRVFKKDQSDLIKASEPNGFKLFGENQLTSVKDSNDFTLEYKKETDFSMDHAEIGFAISSPLLRLEEGKRSIFLKLFFAKFKRPESLDHFNFEYTSEKGWVNLADTFQGISTIEYINSNNINIDLELDPTAPKLKPYDPEIHGGSYQSNHPILKIILKNDFEIDEDPYKYGYTDLKNLILENIKLKVKTDGVQTLDLQSELTVLDNSKPFRPFGPIPAIDSHFYIGHSDLFQQAIDKLKIHIKWKDLPSGNLFNHYENYSHQPTNDSFKISTSLLQDRNWVTIEDNVPLFESNAKSLRSFEIDMSGYVRKNSKRNTSSWNYNTHHGYVRLTLTSPDEDNFRAFGHSVYALAAMNNRDTGVNQPYSPLIEQLTIDYESKEVTFFNHDVYGELDVMDQFYHIEPFGEKKIVIAREQKSYALLPQHDFEGQCFLGFENVVAPQNLSLLFQFIEGSGDAAQNMLETNIQWHYLVGNEWKSINKLDISKDTTRNLIETGILKFGLSSDINDIHQVMPTNLFWLRASMPERTAGLDHLQAIHTQAVEIIEADPTLLSETIEPSTISKLTEGNKGLSSIAQPYSSFDGRAAENETMFYARVSERLRHKDRGVMIWDYERLILDAFPNLYKVKCLNHTNYQTEMVPGHVMIAVVPNLRRSGSKSPFQPKLSLHRRLDIYDFLRERISPFIYLRVENAIYEPIHLSFNVGFHQGFDEGFYGQKLHQQIQEFLSPWAFEQDWDGSHDLVFGGQLHKSVILKFIEDLHYVDFVNDFNMLHVYKNPAIADSFDEEVENEPFYSSFTPADAESPTDTIKMAFHSENEDELTCLIEVEVRFLKGVLELNNEDLNNQFIEDLYGALDRRYKKGHPITKTMIRILVKNMFYVDRIVNLEFHKVLPDGYIMEDTDVAEAKTSRSIMVTAEQHRIGVYRAGDYNCEGNIMIGIGFMIVEADFIVSEVKKENYEHQAR